MKIFQNIYFKIKELEKKKYLKTNQCSQRNQNIQTSAR